MSVFSVTFDFGAPATVSARDDGLLKARRLSARRTSKANVERLINYMYKRSEPMPEKVEMYREQVPGLSLIRNILGAEFRGMYSTGARCFAVVGDKLVELLSDLSWLTLGTLNTTVGRVDFAQGLFSVVVVDGPFGYALRLADNNFVQITDPDFYGSARVAFLDGKFIFTRPQSQQFYWSDGIDNATEYDALDFASAESAPDDLVAVLVDHREVLLAGERTIETWYPTGGEEVYARNNGTVIETGLASAHCIRQIDNSYVWLGRDRSGAGMVWIAGGSNGSQPQRISTNELEEAMYLSANLSQAYAWVYQEGGQTFYVLQVPGLDTTWVWDASIRRWHERAELVNGEYTRWRAECHVYAFGRHLVGDSVGNLYELDPYEYTNGGDVLVRDWITPHSAAPSSRYVFFNQLRLDATLGHTDSGESPCVLLRYSNDGGHRWSDWSSRSTGKVGEYGHYPRWHNLGRARDRVWNFRVTDNCKFSIIKLSVDAKEGAF